MYNWLKRLFAHTSINKGPTDKAITQGLTCKEVVELITDYLEDALLPEQRGQLEEHISGCPGCTNYIEQVQLTIGMLRNLTQEQVFPETKDELLEVFRQWKRN